MEGVDMHRERGTLRVMDKQTTTQTQTTPTPSVLDQLKSIRDSLTLAHPTMYVMRQGETVLTGGVVSNSNRYGYPFVTMNDTDQILEDLAEVL